MKKLKTVLIFIFLNIPAFIQGQNQGINNIWLSGYAGGLGETHMDFISGAPVISQNNIPMDFCHAFSSISDSSGNLLFYTNGVYIADATHDTMFFGSQLNPSDFTTYAYDGLFIPQSNLVVNKPGSNSEYVMFHSTLDNWPSSTDVLSFHLYLTVINMNGNGALGMVTVKNFQLINDSLVPGKIVACKHANGRDWWIICFRSNTNTIYKILLTPGAPSVSTQSIGEIRENFYGQAKFSPDGTRMALLKPQFTTTGSLEIFDFDRCTGDFSNPLQIDITQSTGFNCGLEFSPNSQQLYVCNIDSIYQFDVMAPNIAATELMVAARDSFYQPGSPILITGLGQPQLAPDGRIYLATGNSTTYYHTIDNPDVSGIGCNVSQHSVVLPTYNYNTLPNHPNYFLGCDTTGSCPCLTTDINENIFGEKISARALPNPSTGVFTLQFPVNSTMGKL